MSTSAPVAAFPRPSLLVQLASYLLGFAVLGGVIAFNVLLFGWLGGDYLGWYRANADKLAFTLALAGMAWGDQMESHVELISPHPLRQAGAYLQLIGLTLQAMGTTLRTRGRAAPAALVDILLAVPLLLVAAVGMVAWLLLVAPLQYFVNLVAGAPVRVAMGAGEQTVARVKYDGSLVTREIARSEPEPEGWWVAALAQKPVKLTALFAAVLMFALKLAHVL